MCAVIDPPLFLAIVNTKHEKHAEFGLLKDWLMTGCGKAITGGTQYRAELSRVCSVLGFLADLERAGRVIKFDQKSVDAAADFATKKAGSNDFDDAHLVALVSVSGCKVVCLNDPRAHRFLKKKELYLVGVKKPKLFSGTKNSSLLDKRYQVPCCK